jgi:hypothetical protein
LVRRISLYLTTHAQLMARKPPKSTIFFGSYFERSQRPLQALLFLLPMIGLYEVGILLYAPNAGGVPTRDIYARSLMRDFFEVFGVAAYYLPALIVVVVLLSWHVTRRDPWKVEPKLYSMMLVESFVLAVPLFVFALVMARQINAVIVPLQMLSAPAATAVDVGWQAQLVFSIGAGIYEELLFRLIAIALLHLLLVDMLALPEHIGALGAIGGSAIAFALYHFSSENPFELGLAIYYTLAGIYFAGIFVIRGFGIVAATHALFDVLIVIQSIRGS